jgi:hypothetical protein
MKRPTILAVWIASVVSAGMMCDGNEVRLRGKADFLNQGSVTNPAGFDRMEIDTPNGFAAASAQLGNADTVPGVADYGITLAGTAGPGVLKLDVNLNASGTTICCDQFNQRISAGLVDLFGSASATFDDFIVGGTKSRPTGTAVILHAHLNLTGDMNAVATDSGGGSNSQVWLTVEGTGITPPPSPVPPQFGQVLNTFAFAADAAPAHGNLTFVAPFPSRIPIEILAAAGLPFPVEYEIGIIGNMSAGGAFENGTSASSTLTAFFGHTVSWGGIDSVTDAATGDVIQDWSVTSDSGFDYSKPFVEVPESGGLMLTILALCAFLICSRHSDFRQRA